MISLHAPFEQFMMPLLQERDSTLPPSRPMVGPSGRRRACRPCAAGSGPMYVTRWQPLHAVPRAAVCVAWVAQQVGITSVLCGFGVARTGQSEYLGQHADIARRRAGDARRRSSALIQAQRELAKWWLARMLRLCPCADGVARGIDYSLAHHYKPRPVSQESPMKVGLRGIAMFGKEKPPALRVSKAI